MSNPDLTNSDIEATKAAHARAKACYNAIAVDLQTAFETAAKQATDLEGCATLMAAASIIFQEAITIAARVESNDIATQVRVAQTFFDATTKVVARDISEALSFNLPAPSHAEPR